MSHIFEQHHDKTNIMDQNPCCSLTNPKEKLIANSIDPDETARMRRLVWIHAGCKRTMLVLSWHGTFILYMYAEVCLYMCLYNVSITCQELLVILWRLLQLRGSLVDMLAIRSSPIGVIRPAIVIFVFLEI
jgi:hypothetical protein